jgi:hypothetical protein
VFLHVLNDLAGDIKPGGLFDAFQARRRIDFHDDGPWLARSMSTPHTFSPRLLAARTAVARSSGDKLDHLRAPPRCRFERKSSFRPGPFHGSDNLAADDDRADVGAACFLDEFLAGY